MRILILGGIGEAVALAKRLTPRHEVIYSIAGKGRYPDLACAVRVGGFGGIDGLTAFLRDNGIDLLLDATHPYAAQISRHAARAAERAQIPLWAYRRPSWQPEPGDDWRFAADWAGVRTALAPFRRPFFTIGLEPLQRLTEIPPSQHWLVRCLAAAPPQVANLTLLCATGPFHLDQELNLLRDFQIDVLVAKNSGGVAVEGKLVAARRLGIAVVMLERPALPEADCSFGDVESLSVALTGACGGAAPVSRSPCQGKP
ncbi:MAG: cobalt-precorrin-6A reductase [Candidatus Competibacteraceae bacterium]|nr:cobalt-precorrin-6A reductase [Candidatus Competibacteraceae bacterium]